MFDINALSKKKKKVHDDDGDVDSDDLSSASEIDSDDTDKTKSKTDSTIIYGTLIQTLSDHTDVIIALTYLPNGYLASGSTDKRIIVWNPINGSKLKEIETGWVYSLSNIQNEYLASGSNDSTIKIWNTNDGTQTGHSDFEYPCQILGGEFKEYV
ncbi:unnamed protein product [Brachionus calyciflorus]|uniref:Uncharacterized protein n=1 Tax=Brachionus calyciflorus TaxID=104777 RepID=A0A814STY5_9BILA|nr:unnamed protein product [Brachionus calyciflorus]